MNVWVIITLSTRENINLRHFEKHNRLIINYKIQLQLLLLRLNNNNDNNNHKQLLFNKLIAIICSFSLKNTTRKIIIFKKKTDLDKIFQLFLITFHKMKNNIKL